MGKRVGRWVREVHFVASIVLALLLVFFAITGFMADNRRWFHESIERDQLANPQPFAEAERCDQAGLKSAAGDALGATPKKLRHAAPWLVLESATHAAASPAPSSPPPPNV